MFSSDDDSINNNTTDELQRRGSAALTEALEQIGVYVQDRHVLVQDTPQGPRAAMFVTGTIGRVAFSDRVQRPEQDMIDTLFEDMTDHLVETEYEERRRALDD